MFTAAMPISQAAPGNGYHGARRDEPEHVDRLHHGWLACKLAAHGAQGFTLHQRQLDSPGVEEDVFMVAAILLSPDP
jgi:hypothetical protein